MATSPDTFLKQLYGRLHDRPLPPKDPLYEPIYCIEDEQNEPIDLLTRHIEWNDVESLQFFSGFRGSGKTTELFRLKQRLEERGYFVIYADALEYINPAGQLDISDLLLTLAGAFSDAIEREMGTDLKRESYWTRFRNFLVRTQIDFTEIGAGADGIEVKAALKSSPTFRQSLQNKMAFHIGTLKQDVHRFFEEGVRLVEQRQRDRRVVFIFDSLEQIRGSVSNEMDVIHSVEVVFEQHLEKLRLPYVHAVFTVPPWLKFVLPGLGSIVLLPSVQQWLNDPERTPYEPGVKALRELTRRRLGAEGAQQLFGRPEQADRLISLSGGHFRDLLRLLRECMLRTYALPVSDAVIEKAIAAVRSSFLPIGVEDARWLAAIASSRHTNHRSRADVDRLARFLDTHLVLFFSGEEEWYDIHPLIRDEVEKIARLSLDPPASNPLTTLAESVSGVDPASIRPRRS